MKIPGFLILALASSVAHAAVRPTKPNRAAAPVTPAAAAPVTPAAAAPTLKPQQSNPPDPGDAFTPRSQSGCLSNIGIGLPTGGAYYHPGDPMTIMIRADMFLPESNTGADIVDDKGAVVAPIIPTFLPLNFTTVTTTVPVPTQMTPGTYSLRFQQTYSNTFASGMRSQTLEFQVIVASPGAAIPTPPSTLSVNALGMTVTVPPQTGAPVTASVPGGGNASASANGSLPTSGANTSDTAAGPAATKASGSGSLFYVDSLGIVLAVTLGLIGVLASL